MDLAMATDYLLERILSRGIPELGPSRIPFDNLK
jgi:hypothetical protein